MKILKYTAVLLSIFIFFIWANYFEIYKPLTIFFPTFHILFLSLIIVLSFAYRYLKNTKIPDIDYKPFLLFPLLGFISTLLIDIFFFKRIPHIQDSLHYVSMAQNMLQGRLHHPFIEDYEFFSIIFQISDGEKMFSIFLPGYSAFLLPFVATGTTFLANPLLTALNIFLLGKISQRLFDRKIAVLTMFVTTLSTFVIIMGGTFMSHPFCTALTLIAVYFYLESLEKTGWKAPLVIGIAMGWLVLCRPQNALFLFIPLFLHAAYLTFDKKDLSLIKKFTIAAAAFLPFVAVLFSINYYYTGNITVFKQDLFFNLIEPRNFCHRFGIGRGCPNTNWIEIPKEGLTWGHAFLVSYRRLSSLNLNLFLHPVSLIFIAVAFFRAEDKKELLSLNAVFLLFLFTFGGYFFFFFDGNVFGPRYLYEVSFFLIILIAAGIRNVAELKTEKRDIGTAVRVVSYSFIASAFLFQMFITMPRLYDAYAYGFWEVDSKLDAAVKEKNIHNAVIFISPEHLVGSGLAVMDLGDIEGNDIIYLRNLGPKQNARAMFTYPDRSFYMAKFKDMRNNRTPPEIIPLKKVKDYGEYHVEMEDKNIPLSGQADYCNYFPKTKYIDSYLDFKPPYKLLKLYQRYYFCRFMNEKQFYDFGQKINYSGRYRLSFQVIKGPYTGDFRFFVDDRPVHELKTHEKEFDTGIISFEVDLKKGFRKFRLEPVSSNFPCYFFIDFIDFSLLTRENLTLE